MTSRAPHPTTPGTTVFFIPDDYQNAPEGDGYWYLVGCTQPHNELIVKTESPLEGFEAQRAIAEYGAVVFRQPGNGRTIPSDDWALVPHGLMSAENAAEIFLGAYIGLARREWNATQMVHHLLSETLEPEPTTSDPEHDKRYN